MKKNIQYRHGDVLLEKVEVLPKGGKKRKNMTVMEGELTGHHHRFTSGATVLDYPNGDIFVQVKSIIAPLIHEEHDKIEVPKGNYKVIRQREYDPYQDTIERIKD